MTVNEDLQNFGVRHQVNLQRFSAQATRDLIAILNQADAEIVQQLARRTATLGGTLTSQRMNYMLDAVRTINRDAYVQLGRQLRTDLRGVTQLEVNFQTRSMRNALPIAIDTVTPPAALLNQLVTNSPIQGKLLREWVSELSSNKQRRLRDEIRQGMVQGQTTDQIIRRVRGTAARNFRDGILQKDRAHAAAFVQTAVNDVSSKAKQAFYEENDDLIKSVQWVATLDGITCPECMALDGREFDVDAGRRPPAHINCRCTTVPVTKSWRELGIDLDEAPEGTRASVNGQVPATERYGEWLKKQSKAFQDETLGPNRAALFRDGGLTVDKFTDAKGNTLTLDELRSKYEDEWREAFGSASTLPGSTVVRGQLGDEQLAALADQATGNRLMFRWKFDDVMRADAEVSRRVASSVRKYGIKSQEYFALRDYQDRAYTPLNNRLRNKPSSLTSKQADAYRQLIDSALGKLPKVRRNVYRGLVFDTQPQLNKFLGDFKVGKVVSDPAFLSTSQSRAVAFDRFGGDVAFVIKSKTGRDVSHTLNGFTSAEREVLFSAGTKFRVTAVKTVHPDTFEQYTMVMLKEV